MLLWIGIYEDVQEMESDMRYVVVFCFKQKTAYDI